MKGKILTECKCWHNLSNPFRLTLLMLTASEVEINETLDLLCLENSSSVASLIDNWINYFVFHSSLLNVLARSLSCRWWETYFNFSNPFSKVLELYVRNWGNSMLENWIQLKAKRDEKFLVFVKFLASYDGKKFESRATTINRKLVSEVKSNEKLILRFSLGKRVKETLVQRTEAYTKLAIFFCKVMNWN